LLIFGRSDELGHVSVLLNDFQSPHDVVQAHRVGLSPVEGDT
jgi:hypothetical protein